MCIRDSCIALDGKLCSRLRRLARMDDAMVVPRAASRSQLPTTTCISGKTSPAEAGRGAAAPAGGGAPAAGGGGVPAGVPPVEGKPGMSRTASVEAGEMKEKK
eukprot:3564506-Prymnesium_polylepis.1